MPTATPARNEAETATALPTKNHGSGGLLRATATANDSSLTTWATIGSQRRGKARNEGASVAAIR